METQDETRLRRWEQRALLAAAAIAAVQLVAVVLLDGTAELLVVWSLWPALMCGAIVTLPIDSARGRPFRARSGMAILAATFGGFLVPQFSLPSHLAKGDLARVAATVFAVVGVGGFVVFGAVAMVFARRRTDRQEPEQSAAVEVDPAPTDEVDSR